MSKAFHERVRGFDTLLGTFVKTPSPQLIEALAGTPLDCLCLDAEHGAFGRTELDTCLLTARALAKPTIVRPAMNAPHYFLQALDGGADALLVPHVRSAAEAAAAAKAARFGPGGRGFAGNTRSAQLGARPLAEHYAKARAETIVIAQIEDAEAMGDLDAIAATDGIDALFVGRIDLTVSMGLLDPKDPAVLDAVAAICRAGRKAGKAVGMFTHELAELPRWRDEGATIFLLGSDLGFLQQGAKRLAEDVAGRLA
ncbi:MAG TPA: aldolase/citrate lyase family protein [Azospirillaceae bacterium]|nr:aldolase/citrate lyase family protein [Azospirillaceae bacterium]